MSDQTSIVVPENKSILDKAYISTRSIGHILIICQDVQQERKRLNTLLMAAHRYNKVLDRKLATLVKKIFFCWFTKEALMKK